MPALSPMPFIGAFHLAGAVSYGCERICRGEAEVIVAMDREHDPRRYAAYAPEQVGDQRPEFFRYGIADRVGDVDRGGPGGDGRLSMRRRNPLSLLVASIAENSMFSV